MWMTNAAIQDCPPVEVDPAAFDAVWRFRGWEPCDPPPDPDLEQADEPAPEPTPAPARSRRKKKTSPDEPAPSDTEE